MVAWNTPEDRGGEEANDAVSPMSDLPAAGQLPTLTSSFQHPIRLACIFAPTCVTATILSKRVVRKDSATKYHKLAFIADIIVGTLQGSLPVFEAMKLNYQARDREKVK
jgi:hypothetical protein